MPESLFLNLRKKALLYKMEQAASQNDVTPTGQKRTSTPAPKRFCFLFLNVRHSALLLEKKRKLLLKKIYACIYGFPYWLSR